MVDAADWTGAMQQDVNSATTTKQRAFLLRSVGFDWRVYLGAEVKKVFAEVANWRRDNARVKGDAPNLDRMFVPEYLRKIDPSLVLGF